MAERNEITITVQPTDVGADLVVTGELDLATAAHFFAAVLEELSAGREIRLDLSPLSFCDSAGIRALIDLHQHAETRGAMLTIADASLSVRRVFELGGVAGYLGLDPAPDTTTPTSQPPQLG